MTYKYISGTGRVSTLNFLGHSRGLDLAGYALYSEVMAEEIKYKIKRSRRARRLRIAVYFDSRVVVTVPFGASETVVERFIAEKFSWAAGKIKYFKTRKKRYLPGMAGSFAEHKTDALRLVVSRVEYWNSFYGFGFNKINIKNQRTMWGSCSKKKNLNFNYKIKFLPDHLADYLVIHELCHLQEFNHSKKFWSLVSKAIPDFRNLKKEFREFAI